MTILVSSSSTWRGEFIYQVIKLKHVEMAKSLNWSLRKRNFVILSSESNVTFVGFILLLTVAMCYTLLFWKISRIHEVSRIA